METTLKTTMLVLCCCAALAGCQAAEKGRLAPPEIIDNETEKTDFVSCFTDIVGEFRSYGETLTADFMPHGFVGFTFTGKGGEVVTVDAAALTRNRDTVLYLYPPLDPSDPWAEIWREPIAENDDIDWPTNLNSSIRDVTLPYDGQYLVVVAEYKGRGGSFTVALSCTGGGCLPAHPICGGIAGFPCPEGKWCKLDGTYPDAAGHCIDVFGCEASSDCAAQQDMGLLPTDLPCPGVGWARYECVEGRCTPTCETPEPRNRCERLGGYCTYFMEECSEGMTGANEPGQMLGCEGGRSAKCCVPAAPNPYACDTSADCVMVKADCCGCQMGGSSVAVNRAFADAAQPDPATCEGIMCLAVYNCTGVAACLSGLCGIVDNGSPQASCALSGGTVETASCCMSTPDFPNLCRIGPCGCSPANSHEIQVCQCGDGMCFDGTSCASF
jgi:hypothetical protein